MLFYFNVISSKFQNRNDLSYIELDEILLLPLESFSIFVTCETYDYTAGIYYYWEIY